MAQAAGAQSLTGAHAACDRGPAWRAREISQTALFLFPQEAQIAVESAVHRPTAWRRAAARPPPPCKASSSQAGMPRGAAQCVQRAGQSTGHAAQHTQERGG